MFGGWGPEGEDARDVLPIHTGCGNAVLQAGFAGKGGGEFYFAPGFEVGNERAASHDQDNAGRRDPGDGIPPEHPSVKER